MGSLFNALGGPNWTNRTNWLSDLPLGAWHGVETDEDGRVTKLELGFNDLSGRIPPELGNLTHLQELDLHENVQMSCEIPPELGNLTRLRRLDLSNIPILPAVVLTEWNPDPNPLCTIPPELGNLTNLRELFLGFKNLSGNIPPELGNLSYLYWLDLSYNALSGNIPPELGNLVNLQLFILHANTLTGGIPSRLGDLANLQVLNLGLNDLSGSIPPELGSLSRLHVLDLDSNRLSGSLPPELGSLTKLEILSLAYNEDLSGPLPLTFLILAGTGQANLHTLVLVSTGVCVPPQWYADAEVQAWLETILVGPVTICE